MDMKILEDIGLTKSEISVYLALLEIGSSSTGKIVEKSKASSSKIYEILDRLIQKGLASYIIKSGIKYFEAAPPERILDYFNEKEKRVEEQKKELNNIIPELELKRTLSKHNNEATIFKGLKGGETAFRDLINSMKKDDEWIGFVVSFSNRKYFDLLTKLHEYRSKKGLKARLIFNEKDKDDGEIRKKLKYTEIKYVPDNLKTPAIINVAGNKVLINIMTEDVTVFSIDNKEVADSFRNQFEELWNQETYVVKGLDALQDLFEQMLLEGKCDFIGARGYFMDYRPEYIKDWAKRAEKSGFKLRNIVDPDVKGHTITSFKFTQTKYTLDKSFLDLSVYWIFGNQVAISNWAGKVPIAMIIKNKQIVDMYKKQFELLWNK